MKLLINAICKMYNKITCLKIRRFEEIPIGYDPTKLFLVVDNPATLTTTLFCKLSEVDAMPTNVLPDLL